LETNVSGGVSFQDIDLEASQSQFSKFLDTMCPYFLHYGMTWNEYWFDSLDRLAAFWQKHQFDVEARNQELWMQGIYIQEAVAVVMDTKHRVKYPDRPHRITELTEEERELENKQKIERLREILDAHKKHWDMRKNKGVGSVED
jgi:hypothetical protein